MPIDSLFIVLAHISLIFTALLVYPTLSSPRKSKYKSYKR